MNRGTRDRSNGADPLPRVRVTTLRTAADRAGVLALSRSLLRGTRNAAAEAREGFVTVAYDAPTLDALAATAPQLIAKAGAVVVGYALVLVPEAQAAVPVLAPMFDLLDRLMWRGAPLSSQAYYVMGQVAIAAPYRGQGLFDRLYAAHRRLLSDRYAVCVTEVALRNGRSLAAHARVGFEPVAEYDDPATGETWRVVAWPWDRRGG
jgi:GNAT superfamily N-acetyltransferase